MSDEDFDSFNFFCLFLIIFAFWPLVGEGTVGGQIYVPVNRLLSVFKSLLRNQFFESNLSLGFLKFLMGPPFVVSSLPHGLTNATRRHQRHSENHNTSKK